jgi:hypothetical protein
MTDLSLERSGASEMARRNGMCTLQLREITTRSPVCGAKWLPNLYQAGEGQVSDLAGWWSLEPSE